MTDDEKYMELLKACGELLSEKESQIRYAKYEIDNLKKKLEEAEKQIEEMKEDY